MEGIRFFRRWTLKKRIVVVAALLTLAVLAPRANAIGIMGSWWNQDDLKDGYGVGAIHKISIIPIVSVDIRASWLGFTGEAVEADVFPIEATGRASLGMFYGGVGAGYYIFSGKNDVSIDNDIGLYFVGGIEITPAGIGGFGEVKYTLLETESEGNKVTADGFGINVGVVWGF
jgi:hypothetical protein